MSLKVLKENPIYKVNYLSDSETINAIHVFYGEHLEIEDLTELFKRDPKNPAFIDKNTDLPIFNDEELYNISTKNIHVIFSEQQIHYDDSIGVIKIKIMSEFSNAFSLDEMYLFCMKEESLNPISIYQTLTQNGRLSLTKTRLDQFVLNIIYDENGEPLRFNIPDKEIYDYDDILAMDINSKKYVLTKVLGQKFFIVANEYPYVSNPFVVNEYDDFIERVSRKSLTTLNGNLLLNTESIFGNNIYLCLAKDVLLESQKKGIPEKYAIKLYYPFLWEKNINTLDELNLQKEKLIEDSEKLVNDNTLETFQSVSLFYDIYKEKLSNLNYKKTGIKIIKLTIHSLYKIKIPLDIIFKLIHATDISPLIKYNPSQRQENIYRLYAEKTAKDGRKIPYLSRASIFKLIKTIGKTRSVSIYIQYKLHDETYIIICDFEENGDINIKCEFDSIFPIDEIDNLFKSAVNPIIEEVKNYLEQSGYNINLFKGLLDENVKVERIDYESLIQISKPIKIDEIIGCVSSVFIVESKNFKKGIQMRFKRVSNFNKLTSREAFVIDQAKQKDGLKGSELITALMQNYSITENEAREIIAKLASEIQLERGARRSEIEIKINPGFKTTITLNSITSIISIKVENINDINYLYTLPIYLDSFIRLTQDKSSTRVPLEKINSTCGSDEKDEIVIKDIVSAAESNFLTQEVPLIEGDNLEFLDFNEYMESSQDNEGKVKNALDLFFGDEDEEEDSQESSGGNKVIKGGVSSQDNSDSQSEKSLSSFGSLPLEADETKESEEPLSSFESLPPQENEIVEPQAPVSKPDAQLNEDLYDEIKPSVSLPKKMVKKTSVKFDLVEPEKVKTQQQPNIVRNIEKLSNPNPFQSRMEELEPILFNNPKQNGKFNSYSRSCLHSSRKQPVILTEEEMQKINDEQPGFLERGKSNGDILKYGSNPDNQYYYLCPRYWCLKTNSPISAEDVKKGVCGKVIPRNRTVVKPGEYVFEFYDKSEHGTPENYIQHYPGFLESDKHPDGLCMPCCFKNWNTPTQIERRKQCGQNLKKEKEAEVAKAKEEERKEGNEEGNEEGDEEGDEGEENEQAVDAEKQANEDKQEKISSEIDMVASKKATKKEDYIKGPEKFPLEQGRWGYLPMSIQKFLNEVNANCQISKTNTNIKPHHTCLLRHGIEVNSNQSFIACIADARYFDGSKTKIPTIKEMKEIIIKALTLDNFITYQNGDLISIFMKDNENDTDKMNIKKYTSTNLYKKINKKNEKDMLYFLNVVNAFENFMMFLRDNKITIDYTYLWDIICKPNPKIFIHGINLVILELSNNDTTNNVELICPTNHYSSEFFEARKQTLIVLKNGDYYEPIYAYRNEETKINIDKTFSEYNQQTSKSMRAIFKKLIKPLLKNTCVPLSSMPENVYRFKTPILLDNLIKILNKYDYQIKKQIVNYQGKVISIYCKNPEGLKGVVPCFPSSINLTYDYVMMSDETMYETYENTVKFLTKLSNDTRKKIQCLPEFKVIEDEMIVGIITETNQFIQLSEPFPLSEAIDDIKLLNDNNYLIADSNTLLSKEVDKERVEYIKKIKLETNFYNVFRNTIRILLNKYENIKLREKIEESVKNGYMLYNVKLLSIIKQLKELVNDSIIFSDEYDYTMINDISTCIVLDKDKCNGNRPLCAFSTGNTCQLILPKQNLLTNADNEIYYFGKMSDELIRYSRINSFIFQPQTYLSFGSLGYNLREDEIIVIQSLLNAEYFEGLIPSEINKYAKNNSYDIAEPIITQNYENKINIDDALNPTHGEEDGECVPISTGKISSNLWKNCFPENFDELLYDKTLYCGFYMLIDIVNRKKNIQLSLSQIKNILLEEYVKYLISYENKVIDILIEEGKKTLGDQVKSGTLSFQNFIYTDSYFVTNFDIWLIMTKYDIPCILISSKTLLETQHTKTVFVMHGELTSEFVFIVSPGLRAENIPKYKIIQSPEKKIFMPITITSCQGIFNDAINNKINIEEYLTNYTRSKTTQYKLKNPNPNPIPSQKMRVKKLSKTKLKLITDEGNDNEEKHEEQIVNEYEQQIDIAKSRKKRGNVIIKRNTKKNKKFKLVEIP